MTLRLGLIGGNITATRSPALHVLCGLSVGLNVTYDLLIPAERGMGFDALLDHCAQAGFQGVNVTYPHKEEAAARVTPGLPLVGQMGSSNTVRFGPEGARAFNTDCTGFEAAFRARWPDAAPGRVLVMGTGGVGRAVAFALARLGAASIVLADTDAAKVASLRAALAPAFAGRVEGAEPAIAADLTGFDGVVNCTPLGMVGRPGSPLPPGATGRPAWAFDAVYTPSDTPFRAQVTALGADFLDGWELYFHQGVQAFEIFSGRRVTDTAWVRACLLRQP